MLNVTNAVAKIGLLRLRL